MWDSKRDTEIKNRLLDSVGEGEGKMIWENSIEHVYYHVWNRSPVQVRCMKQGTQSQHTGTTQREGMGREVGGKFRMGDTCTPMVDLCQCMAKKKPLQYYKVISLQLNKFIKKKKLCPKKYLNSCRMIMSEVWAEMLSKITPWTKVDKILKIPFMKGAVKSCLAIGKSHKGNTSLKHI